MIYKLKENPNMVSDHEIIDKINEIIDELEILSKRVDNLVDK